jgi:hypothetical protein
MKIRHGVGVALAAAVTLAAAAAAGPDAAKQRVVLTTKGVASIPSSARFVLLPLQGGALGRDSGREGAGALPPERVVMRDGQKVTVYDRVIETLEGRRGTLVIRSRIEYVEAGSGYHVGTGTWKVVRGTGDYAGVTGGGRRGDVWLDRGPWSGRNEGFLSVP